MNSVENCKRGDPLEFFDIHCVGKYRNKRREDPLVESKKNHEKSHNAEKNPSEKHQRGILCFQGSGRRCFCFGRGVSSLFWTSVVQVDEVEQMNKKVDRTSKTNCKWTHCKSRAHFLLKCGD